MPTRCNSRTGLDRHVKLVRADANGDTLPGDRNHTPFSFQVLIRRHSRIFPADPYGQCAIRYLHASDHDRRRRAAWRADAAAICRQPFGHVTAPHHRCDTSPTRCRGPLGSCTCRPASAVCGPPPRRPEERRMSRCWATGSGGGTWRRAERARSLRDAGHSNLLCDCGLLRSSWRRLLLAHRFKGALKEFDLRTSSIRTDRCGVAEIEQLIVR